MASSEELLRAVQLATRTLSGSGHIDTLLQDVLAICVQAVGASGGTIYLHDDRNSALVFRHVLPEEVRAKLQFNNIPDDYGVAGQAFSTRQTIISDFEPKPEEQLNKIEEQTGVQVRTMITLPLQMQDVPPIGVVQLINKLDGKFDEEDVTVLDTVAAVATMAYFNAKLTDEATRASTLLGMGKVSHDIGNLAASLHATIAITEMTGQTVCDGLNATSETQQLLTMMESLQESIAMLKSSVDRIVGYSRLISDLSAGRQPRPSMELASLAETIEGSASFLESSARSKGIELKYEIDHDTPAALHDQQFIFRIVQNLVGNAIKAVSETYGGDDVPEDGPTIGTVTVRYRFTGGQHTLEVHDSGPGMPKEVAEGILAGTARSQWIKGSGSGWGTKIVLELAATHDGRVEIDSEPGRGTTFRILIPHREE